MCSNMLIQWRDKAVDKTINFNDLIRILLNYMICFIYIYSDVDELKVTTYIYMSHHARFLYSVLATQKSQWEMEFN